MIFEHQQRLAIVTVPSPTFAVDDVVDFASCNVLRITVRHLLGFVEVEILPYVDWDLFVWVEQMETAILRSLA